MRALASQELNPMIIPPDILKNILHKIETDIKSHARLKLCDDQETNISALAAEKLQIRCVMETRVITIKPPLQVVDIGNGCEAYSASIYIPAKSKLTTTLLSIT